MGHLIGGVVLAASMVLSQAHAVPFRGNDGACQNMVMHSMNVAQMRDAGVKWQDFEAWIMPRLEESVPDETTYIKSKADISFVMGWFKRIYDEPAVTGEQFYPRIYAACMKKPVNL